jgi:hypothetical protein
MDMLFKPYDTSDIHPILGGVRACGGDLEKVSEYLRANTQKILDIESSWDEVDTHNSGIRANWISALEFNSANIYNTKGIFRAWVVNMLRDMVPRRPDIWIYIGNILHSIPVRMSSKTWESVLTQTIRTNAQKQASPQAPPMTPKDKGLRRQALELKLDPNAFNTIALLKDAVEEFYAQLHYPDGKEVEHDQCQECSSWVVGERRCVCGNVRISLEASQGYDGRIYVYPMRY